MTIDECIQRIEQFPNKIAKRGEDIMRQEVPVGKTGKLRANVTSTASPSFVHIYTQTFYAGFVRFGRGEVRPVEKKALWWEDLSHPVGRARKSDANPFNVRAADKLRGQLKSLF